MDLGTVGNVPKFKGIESKGRDSNSNESDSVNTFTPYAEFFPRATKALIPTVTTRYFQPFASIISA